MMASGNTTAGNTDDDDDDDEKNVTQNAQNLENRRRPASKIGGDVFASRTTRTSKAGRTTAINRRIRGVQRLGNSVHTKSTPRRRISISALWQ